METEDVEFDDFHTPEAVSSVSSVEEDGADKLQADFYSAEEAASLSCSDTEESGPHCDSLHTLSQNVANEANGQPQLVERLSENVENVSTANVVRRIFRDDPEEETKRQNGSEQHFEMKTEHVKACSVEEAGEPQNGSACSDHVILSSKQVDRNSTAVDPDKPLHISQEPHVHISQTTSDEEEQHDEAADKLTQLIPLSGPGSQASSEMAPSEDDDERVGPVHAFAQASTQATQLDVAHLRKLFKQYPKAVKEVDTDGRLPVHCLAQNCREATEHDVILLHMFLKKYRAGAEELDDEGNNVLHCLTQNERPANEHDVDMLKVLIEKFPQTAKQKDGDEMYPLQSLVNNSRKSNDHDLEMVTELVKTFPKAVKNRNRDGLNVVHCLCLKKAEGTQHDAVMLQMLSEWFPEAVKKRDGHGRYPLHCLARNERPANEFDAAMMAALVQSFPDAVRAKDDEGFFPFNCLALSARERTDPHLIMAASLLEAFPEAEENEGEDKRNSWPLKGPREDVTDSICVVS